MPVNSQLSLPSVLASADKWLKVRPELAVGAEALLGVCTVYFPPHAWPGRGLWVWEERQALEGGVGRTNQLSANEVQKTTNIQKAPKTHWFSPAPWLGYLVNSKAWSSLHQLLKMLVVVLQGIHMDNDTKVSGEMVLCGPQVFGVPDESGVKRLWNAAFP